MRAVTAGPQAAAIGPAIQSGRAASPAALQSSGAAPATRRATALTMPETCLPRGSGLGEPHGAIDGGVRRNAVEVHLGNGEAQRVQGVGRRPAREKPLRTSSIRPRWRSVPRGERLRPGAFGRRQRRERPVGAGLIGEAAAVFQNPRNQGRRRPARREAWRAQSSLP